MTIMAKTTVILLFVFSVCGRLAVTAATTCAEELADANGQPPMPGRRVPVCDSAGDYAPKQCSGARCYCVKKNGNMIRGYFANRWEADDQNCKCARDQAEYMERGIIGKMHRCSRNGNYKPIQCTGSACYCVDEDGIPTETSSVHISRFNELQC